MPPDDADRHVDPDGSDPASTDVGPLSSVTEQFAWDEGEGERTRTSWVAGHDRYFRRLAEREGFTFHPELATVFERFVVLWPPSAADG